LQSTSNIPQFIQPVIVNKFPTPDLDFCALEMHNKTLTNSRVEFNI